MPRTLILFAALALSAAAAGAAPVEEVLSVPVEVADILGRVAVPA